MTIHSTALLIYCRSAQPWSSFSLPGSDVCCPPLCVPLIHLRQSFLTPSSPAFTTFYSVSLQALLFFTQPLLHPVRHVYFVSSQRLSKVFTSCLRRNATPRMTPLQGPFSMTDLSLQCFVWGNLHQSKLHHYTPAP